MRYSGLILATILYFLLYLAFLNYYESFFSFLDIPVPDRGIVAQTSTLSFVIFWISVLFPMFLIMKYLPPDEVGAALGAFLGVLGVLFVFAFLIIPIHAKIIATLFFGLAAINAALAVKLSEIHSHIEYYLRSRKEKKKEEKIKQLGRSSFLIEKEGKIFLRKYFGDRPDYEKREVIRGISYWIQLSNIGIPGIQKIKSFDTSKNCIDIEFVDGKTLRNLLNEKGRLEEKEACKIAFKIAEIMNRVHELGFVHRDLKPENIVIKNGEVFILDWEFVAKEGDEVYGVVGSAAYSPRERENFVSKKIDVYSFGVILNEMLTGSVMATYVGHKEGLFKIINNSLSQKFDMKTILEELRRLL